MIDDARSAAGAWLAAIREPDARADRDRQIVEPAEHACARLLDLASTSGGGIEELEQASDMASRDVMLVLRRAQVVPGRVAAALQALGAAVRSAAGDRDTSRLDAILAQLNANAAQRLAEQAAREHRELSGRLEVFARTLSHELKNPIGAADGAVHMLLDESIASDAAQRKRFAEMIARNVRRALDLVNDLRSLADSEAAPRKTRLRSLRSIIEDVVHEVSGPAEEGSVSVSVLEPIPDARVDAARVTLVLMNLAWNAVKYADPAKSQRWARIGVTPADGDWHCFVADNGLGVPAEAQERIFEPFHREHANAASGTGLGLSIARETVTQLGGRLWLESEPALGSTFHFTVPADSAVDVS